MTQRERALPVFVYPTIINFYVATPSTHKQLLSLYNPYDFPVKYKVFINKSSRSKYSLVESKGSIAAHSSIDLLVYHNAPSAANCGANDKFLVTMQDTATLQVLGKRYILVNLLPGDKDSSSNKGDEENFQQDMDFASQVAPHHQLPHHQRPLAEDTIRKYALVLAICMVFVLILPTKFEPEPPQKRDLYFFHYLIEVGYSVKLICAFALGFTMMAIVRPW